jgi:hypothetical protein
VLSELSNLSASAAEHLRLESLMEGETLEKLEKDRTYLRYLAVRPLSSLLQALLQSAHV